MDPYCGQVGHSAMALARPGVEGGDPPLGHPHLCRVRGDIPTPVISLTQQARSFQRARFSPSGRKAPGAFVWFDLLGVIVTVD